MNAEMALAQQFSEDKSTWGDGPWRYEPDRLDFEHEGLACLLHRGPGGHWCGYVGVPPTHALYGKGYDDADVNVHGGLTYASKCSGTICHVPKPGSPDDVWWFGFDCAHSGDLSSMKYASSIRSRRGDYNHAKALAANTWTVETYRTFEYVKAETERLAEQLAKLATAAKG
jgi:hypothetical protein